MNGDTNGLVAKLWSYCNVLRDDGLSYQDYLEQLTFLLFLKMADEREAQGRSNPVPDRCLCFKATCTAMQPCAVPTSTKVRYFFHGNLAAMAWAGPMLTPLIAVRKPRNRSGSA